MQEAAALRSHIARSLEGRADAIIRDAVAVYPFAGMETVGLDDRAHLTGLVLQLINAAVRDGNLPPRHATVAELRRLATDKQVDARTLFAVVYFVERAATDELALDDSFGIDAQSLPALTQLVRRASLEVCAALSEQMHGAGAADLVDALTTLFTRAVFMAALEKEIYRSERLGHPFALMLIDVDHLGEINARHGYGAGDRVLERVGIVVRTYFRETDWVARLGGDTFAVLLPEIHGASAARLAERMRVTVQERLQLHDHRSDMQVPLTISVGVLVARSIDRGVKAERLVEQAEIALQRAIRAGGNRVERAEPIIADPAGHPRNIMPIE